MKESVTYQEIRLDAKAEGREEEKTRIALNMLNSNISIELIAQFTGLSVEEIERLR
jgi:predicted transposase/invertase (TIGR01784 family)